MNEIDKLLTEISRDMDFEIRKIEKGFVFEVVRNVLLYVLILGIVLTFFHVFFGLVT